MMTNQVARSTKDESGSATVKQSKVIKKVKYHINQIPWLSNSLAWLLNRVTENGRKKQRVAYYEKLHREEFFYKCTKFLSFNNIRGDYLEFGCYSGMTFRLAHKYAHFFGLKMHFFAFDSFEGLPALKEIDNHLQWYQGQMTFSTKQFENILKSAGIKKSEYTAVPGYYSDSLSNSTLEKLNLKRAAFVYVDCDLYESTVPVLNFILPLLQTGTVIAFDDFYCFDGNPDRGEQLALREFMQRNPNIDFTNFLTYGWSGRSFIIKKRESPLIS